MRKKVIKNIPNALFYIVGIFIAAFGVSLMKKSGLGLGPFGVAAIELQLLLRQWIPFFTFGMASAVHTYLMFLTIVLINRNVKSMFVVVSILFINGAVDLFDLVILKNLVINNHLTSAMAGHGIGFLAYSFGSALLIISKLPGLVIEEFTFSIMKITKSKNYTVIRTFVAYSGFGLAIIYSLITLSGLTSVTFLSFIQGFAFGPVIGWFVRTIKGSQIPLKLRLNQSL
jgi:uncharacterized membrane protein YczE